MQGSGATTRLASIGTYSLKESIVAVPTAAGTVRARYYLPIGRTSPPGMVLLHGVHYLGIDEPRLVKFARNFAESGVAVLTPELKDLDQYQILPGSIDVIGASAHELRERTGKPVGVMGLSFAGGLALLAASDRRYAPDMSLVVAVGGHDSLYRVAKFLVTGAAEAPDGTVSRLAPEQYGALVLVYGHAQHFFSDKSTPVAQETIRLWLAEKYSAARQREASLSPAEQATLEALFRYDMQAMRPRLLAEIERDRAQFDDVSPQGRLGALCIPVFLLHGATDAVIPSTETLWLAREIPASTPSVAVITPAMGHVDPRAHLALSDHWQLINFMAKILERLNQEKGTSQP